jgi:hypothetical protein
MSSAPCSTAIQSVVEKVRVNLRLESLQLRLLRRQLGVLDLLLQQRARFDLVQQLGVLHVDFLLPDVADDQVHDAVGHDRKKLRKAANPLQRENRDVLQDAHLFFPEFLGEPSQTPSDPFAVRIRQRLQQDLAGADRARVAAVDDDRRGHVDQVGVAMVDVRFADFKGPPLADRVGAHTSEVPFPGEEHVPAEGAEVLPGDRGEQLAAKVVDPRGQSGSLVIGVRQLLEDAGVDDTGDVGDCLSHRLPSIIQRPLNTQPGGGRVAAPAAAGDGHGRRPAASCVRAGWLLE